VAKRYGRNGTFFTTSMIFTCFPVGEQWKQLQQYIPSNPRLSGQPKPHLTCKSPQIHHWL